MNRIGKLIFVAAALTCLVAVNLYAAGVTPGDVVVVRVGDGGTALTANTAPVFLDEYTEAGFFVQTIAMPTGSGGGQLALTMSGSATAEGDLTLSPDGLWLALTGFNTGSGVASPASVAASTLNRSIGIVSVSSGAIDTSTGLNAANGNGDPRGAVTSNGTDIWQANSSAGIQYTTKTTVGAGTQLYTTLNNTRRVDIFNPGTGNQLYFSDASGSSFRLGTVGSGLPTTTGTTLLNLPPAFPTTGTGNGAQPYSFEFLNQTGGLTLYVADAANGFSPTGVDGVEKWSLVGGSWVNNGFISVPGVSNNVSGVSGYVDGSGNAHIFFTSGGADGGPALSQTNLMLYVDTAGYNAAPAGTATVIAMAGANEVFRGVEVIPVPEPSTMVTVGVGLVGLLALRRRRS